MMNLQYMAVIKGSQIVDRTLSKIYSQIMQYCYTKELCRLLSGACPITGRRSKGKGLEVPCKYYYYCGPTKDPAFIFVIILFPQPLTRPGVYMRVAVIEAIQ